MNVVNIRRSVVAATVVFFVAICLACGATGPPHEEYKVVIVNKHLVAYEKDEWNGDKPAILIVDDGEKEYSFKYWPQDIGFNTPGKSRREDSIDFFKTIKVGNEYLFTLEYGTIKKVEDFGKAKKSE